MLQKFGMLELATYFLFVRGQPRKLEEGTDKYMLIGVTVNDIRTLNTEDAQKNL